MNILITGGAGFIGSTLAGKLLQDHHQVGCIDNFDDFYSPEIKKGNIAGALKNPAYHLYHGDIRDSQFLDQTMSDFNPDLVVHLAARAGVRPSIMQPELYYDVNVTGTLRLLEAMKKAGTNKLLFASSSSVYGNNRKIPFEETDNVDFPISPYAATKKAGELMCHTWHHLYGFDIFCFRFFTVYGPRQRPEMAIHYFTRNILEGKPVNLFGTGETRRDYTFVDDIVQGITNSINRLKGYEIINLGGSDTISLIQLVREIENAAGVKAVINYLPMQPGDVEVTYAGIDKASALLAYQPETRLKEGIKKFVDWYRSLQKNENPAH